MALSTIDWPGLHAMAFPPEHDWDDLAEQAGHALGMGPWFLAGWDSRCKGCGSAIYEGDTVRISDDEGGAVCLDCGALGE